MRLVLTHASLRPRIGAHTAPLRTTTYLILTLALTLWCLSPVAGIAAPLPQSGDVPEISARAAIVVEYPSGRILYTKDEHARLAPASTTKIMTAILALEYGKLDDLVTATPDDLVGESSMGLHNGEQQTMHELLYGMLLPSGNDAAMAIARTLGSRVVAGDLALKPPVARFAEMMNVRVGQLGLEDTHFVNPHGLDVDGHYSSAYDLASLSWYALHIPEFNEIVSQITHDAPGHSLLNTNELLTRYDGADGIKTGLTDNAGLCLVGSATRDGHRLISVVLNAPRWYADTTAILDYGYAQLTADPVGTGAEQLSVSKRGAVSWLLGKAGDGVAPPMPLLSPGLQGGGSPSSSQNTGIWVVGLQPAGTPLPVALNSAPRSDDLVVQPPAPVVASAGRSDGSLAWVLAIFVIVGVVFLFKFSHRLRSPGVFRGFANLLPALLRNAEKSATVEAQAPEQPRDVFGMQLARRREPNLLLSSLDERRLHVERAISLALEDREGSSMSEFIMALRYGDLDVAELASEYRLPPTAFLALARAQVALSRSEDARRTLLHGATVLPHHRPLRMALHQYTR